MSSEAVVLLLSLFAAHFVGDFTPLLTGRMLTAKRTGRPVYPIALHAVIHGTLSAAAIGIVASPRLGTLALGAAIVLVSHFAIDLGRAELAAHFPAFRDSDRRIFWSALGFDQLLHGIMLITVAAVVL